MKSASLHGLLLGVGPLSRDFVSTLTSGTFVGFRHPDWLLESLKHTLLRLSRPVEKMSVLLTYLYICVPLCTLMFCTFARHHLSCMD